MNEPSLPRPAMGASDFRELRQLGSLYVDKTPFVARVLDDPAKVILLPRPRRFGKTTNLSTLRWFLGRSAEDLTGLFSDLKVWESPAARGHFQKYPVIYLTLKDVKNKTWEGCFAAVAELLAVLYNEHRYLLPGLDPEAAEIFTAILHRRAAPAQCEAALLRLSQHLHHHHGERVVILLDEYDSPLHTAFTSGYFDDAVDFFRSFLSAALKDNEHLFKSVLTGILRIARESIFSGLNNLSVYSLLDADFATDFGFTEQEVLDLLLRLRSARKMEDLRRWYNGYDFGGHVIYNPWSVLSALSRDRDPLQPYWVNTASDEMIRELLFRFGGGEEGEGEALLRGDGVRYPIVQDTVLRDIYREPDALWSFLLFTGYLKAEDVAVEVSGNEGRMMGTLKVPNLEVGTVFAGLFRGWLQKGVGGERRLQELSTALLRGDLEIFQEGLERLLLESASFLDGSNNKVKMPPEHVYQAFILGLLVHMQPRYLVRSNRESGHGRYDVMVCPREAGLPGAVLELKVRKKGETLQSALGAAKKQLLACDYAAELRANGASPIQQVAVAFDGKKVLVGTP